MSKRRSDTDGCFDDDDAEGQSEETEEAAQTAARSPSSSDGELERRRKADDKKSGTMVVVEKGNSKKASQGKNKGLVLQPADTITQVDDAAKSSGVGNRSKKSGKETKGLVLLPADDNPGKKNKKLTLFRRKRTSDENSPSPNHVAPQPPSLMRQQRDGGIITTAPAPPSLTRQQLDGITAPPSLARSHDIGGSGSRGRRGLIPTAHGAYRINERGNVGTVGGVSDSDDNSFIDEEESSVGHHVENPVLQGELAAHNNIVLAEPIVVVQDDNKEDGSVQRRGLLHRLDYLLIAIAVVVLATLVGVWLGLSRRGEDGTEQPAPSPSASGATTVPSMSPTTVSEFIQVRSPWTSFEDAESPQSLALEWIETDERSLRFYESDDRLLLLERFALAVLAFASNSNITGLVADVDAACFLDGITEPDSLSEYECDGDGHLTYINLGVIANGTLPPEIGLLTRLSSFRWTGAFRWSGSIPSQVGLLTSLEEFDLTYGEHTEQRLTGRIPSEMGMLDRLEALSLDGHAFHYPLPTSFWQLRSLKGGKIKFDFAGNIGDKFYHFPSQVGQLTALTQLIHLLPSDWFAGPIPTEIGLLSELGTFHIEWSIIGTLPTEIGSLSQVKVLNATYQLGLEGTIPSQIGSMTSLEHVVISRTHLAGHLPSEMGSLTALTELSIMAPPEGNRLFSWTLPTEIGKLTNLEKIHLEGTHMQNFLISEMGRLTNLSYFYVAHLAPAAPVAPRSFQVVSPTLFPSEIGLLTELELLVLHHSIIVATIPVEITRLQKLQVLDLSSNYLEGPIPTGLFSIPNLYHLNLNDVVHRNSSIPSEIGLFATNLEKNLSTTTSLFVDDYINNKVMLGLARTGFNGSIPSEIGRSHALQVLNIGENLLSGVVPTELGLLSSALEHLNLGRGNFNLSWTNEMPVLSSLTTLLMDNMKLSSIPTFVFHLPNLRELDLSLNPLPEIPTEFASLTTLTRLALNAVMLGGVGGQKITIPTEVGSLQRLTSLELAWNELDSPFPSEFWDLRNLRLFDVRSAGLSGTLPTEILQLSSLIVLHLENNPNLTGSIPEGFESLLFLKDLFLYGTDLTGTIDCDKTTNTSSMEAVTLNNIIELDFEMDPTLIAVVECDNVVDCKCCVNEYFNATC